MCNKIIACQAIFAINSGTWAIPYEEYTRLAGLFVHLLRCKKGCIARYAPTIHFQNKQKPCPIREYSFLDITQNLLISTFSTDPIIRYKQILLDQAVTAPNRKGISNACCYISCQNIAYLKY